MNQLGISIESNRARAAFEVVREAEKFLDDRRVIRRGLEIQFPEALFVSLQKGVGIDALKVRLSETVKKLHVPRLLTGEGRSPTAKERV